VKKVKTLKQALLKLRKQLKHQGRKLALVGIILAVALIGMVVVLKTHAAGVSITLNASNGTLTGTATRVTDPTASNGTAVNFGAPASGGGGPLVPAGFNQTFLDNFDGSAGTRPSAANWMYDIGTNYPGGAGNWGTGEIESATDSTNNVFLDGQGHLVIKPIGAGNWTSGRIETQRTDFAAPAGGQMLLTARIQQPNPTSALGYWPAFWALGAPARPVGATNWPSIGELDVLEDINGLSQVSHTFHCGVWGQPPCNEPEGIGSGLLPCPGCQTDYHVYSVILDRSNASAEQLRFYLDGNLDYTVNQNAVSQSIWDAAVHHGFFMILNVAIGGSYPDKVCGCYSAGGSPTSGAGMSVDYVAAYTKP
jgi:hypothetical protein